MENAEGVGCEKCEREPPFAAPDWDGSSLCGDSGGPASIAQQSRPWVEAKLLTDRQLLHVTPVFPLRPCAVRITFARKRTPPEDVTWYILGICTSSEYQGPYSSRLTEIEI